MIEPVVPRFLHLQYVPRLLCDVVTTVQPPLNRACPPLATVTTRYGLGAGKVGLVFSAVPFAYLIAMIIVGKLADKSRKWKLVLAGMTVAGVGLVTMWLAR